MTFKVQKPVILGTVKPVLNGHTKKKPKISFSRPIFAKCMSKVLQNGAFCIATFIKLPFVIKIRFFVLSILSGRFTQALLYNLLDLAH